MRDFVKMFTRANAFFYKLTAGRLGSHMGRQSVLLLHTLGRKSGKPYTTPLSYYRDGENYLLVASNWGKADPPDWFRNLMAQSSTTIQVKGKTIKIVARQAGDEEYQRLWELVTHQNPQYLAYQKGLSRQIAIVIMTPVMNSVKA
jgi:F420H(2)-dependent quinone reductase